MYSQSQTDILLFLDEYLKDTPAESVKKQVEEVSQLEFSGTAATDYFMDFSKHYEVISKKIPQKTIIDGVNISRPKVYKSNKRPFAGSLATVTT